MSLEDGPKNVFAEKSEEQKEQEKEHNLSAWERFKQSRWCPFK